ncbi:hypothetical protein HJC23_013399, partial [Cyclotella cryptica]
AACAEKCVAPPLPDPCPTLPTFVHSPIQPSDEMRMLLILMFNVYATGLAFTLSPNIKCKSPVLRTPVSLWISRNDASSRAEFVSRSLASSLAIMLSPINECGISNAFDGGVGGLGKTRPVTGVVFRDPEAVASTSNGEDLTNELLAPDGTPAFVTFSAPWPLLRSAAGIEARDIAGGFESSFVQVAELPKGITTMDEVKPAVLSEVVFGSTGKFGMYGAPTDIKIKKISQSSNGMTVYSASFTCLTPAMRESDRKAYISASVVGNGLFMLVTSTTSTRFTKFERVLRGVAESFTAIPAPRSSFRKLN